MTRDRAAEAWWQEHGVSPEARPQDCEFCGHPYLKPCTEEQHVNCANFNKKPKVAEPEPVEEPRRRQRRKR